jgi:hypothetical protein
MQPSESLPTFQRNTSPPTSRPKNTKPSRQQENAGFLTYPSTLKMEAICSSKTSHDFHPTTQRYFPEIRKSIQLNYYVQFINITTRVYGTARCCCVMGFCQCLRPLLQTRSTQLAPAWIAALLLRHEQNAAYGRVTMNLPLPSSG